LIYKNKKMATKKINKNNKQIPTPVQKNKNKMKQIKLYFCPECNSKDVHHPFELKNLFGVIPKWRCRECNFQSPIFPLAVFNSDAINQRKNKLNQKKK